MSVLHKLESVYGKGEIIMRRKKEAEERRKQAEESVRRMLEDPDFCWLVAYYDALAEMSGITAEDALKDAMENRKEHRSNSCLQERGAKNENQTSGRRKETKVFINQDTYEYLVKNKGDKSLSYAIAEIVEQHIEKMKNPPVRF